MFDDGASKSHDSMNVCEGEGDGHNDEELKVDWLDLRFDLNEEDEEQIVPAMIGYVADKGAPNDYGIIPAGKKLGDGCEIAFQVLAQHHDQSNTWSDEVVASVRIRKGKGGKRALFVDIHPPGLTGKGAERVQHDLLRYILNRSPDQIRGAVVKRVDVAQDLAGVKFDRFAWRHDTKQICRPFVKKRNLLSVGLGSPTHGAVAIYDKAASLKLPAGVALTRVEARLRPGCLLTDLPGLSNPFSGVRVTDVHAAWKKLGRHRIEAEGMLAKAQLNGLEGIVALFGDDSPVPFYQQVRSALKESTPIWWQPEARWKGWHSALTSALPGII